MSTSILSAQRERGAYALVAACLAGAMPLLYVYMPRPPIPGAHFLLYPALSGILLALSLVIIGSRRHVDLRIAVVVVLLILSAVAAGVSSIANAPALRATAPLETLRPAVFAVFLIYGYLIASVGGETPMRRGLLWAAYVILGGQLVIAATQLLGISAFDVVYSEDKSRPFGSLVRVTGSLGNPNIFGWIVAQMSIFVFLLSASWTRYAWLCIGAILVVLSGSRTILLMYPFMVAFSSIVGHGGFRRISWKTLAFSGGIGVAFLFVVMSLGAYFPYLAQLRSVVTSGSLTSVNAFQGRVNIWTRAYTEFSNADDIAWLFGLGSRAATRVLDNDILYVFFRGGVLGLLAHVALIVCAAVIFVRARQSAISLVGLQYLLFAFLLGMVADTLGGWLAPLLLFYLLGTTVGVSPRVSSRNAGAAAAGRREPSSLMTPP